jgi:hypothetical protein
LSCVKGLVELVATVVANGGFMSQANVGNIDRAVRIVLGFVLVALAARGTIGHWGYIGVVLLLTSVVALCPIYTLFGLGTTSR